jgi:hypothetical protein
VFYLASTFAANVSPPRELSNNLVFIVRGQFSVVSSVERDFVSRSFIYISLFTGGSAAREKVSSVRVRLHPLDLSNKEASEVTILPHVSAPLRVL